uniref:uncharacterized protein LOC120348511 n=1 Tax=Styela clava TaxID=7725 RepID=UPI001939D035|nr:uncharacterized protein LOC120348511 [Styela clava]
MNPGNMDDQDMSLKRERAEKDWNVIYSFKLIIVPLIEEARANGVRICLAEKKEREKLKQEIYRCIEAIIDWRRFVQDTMGISTKKLRRIIAQSRLIDIKIKMEILKFWKNNNAKTQDKESLREELLELAGNFLERTATSDAFRNRNFKFISHIVAAAIPDEDWLEFSRTKLKLSDKEIENIIRRHGEFSDEFKYQLIKKLQQEEMEDPSWQKWKLQDDENSSDISYKN